MRRCDSIKNKLNLLNALNFGMINLYINCSCFASPDFNYSDDFVQNLNFCSRKRFLLLFLLD